MNDIHLKTLVVYIGNIFEATRNVIIRAARNKMGCFVANTSLNR